MQMNEDKEKISPRVKRLHTFQLSTTAGGDAEFMPILRHHGQK
jgi:hypothetical protein